MDYTLKFESDLENFLKIIIKNAHMSNARVFFVGGVVRDTILKRDIEDFDLILEGNAVEFAKKLPKEIEIKSIHDDFKTVKVLYKNKTIDIASTRLEEYPYYGSLPVVTKIGVDIKEDSNRRDFTINSMYFELNLKDDEITYTLHDFHNGLEDIEKKCLQVLHEKSYADDPTRILRGLNFKYRLDFNFTTDDRYLIENTIVNSDFSKMSLDRFNSVLYNILKTNNADTIFLDFMRNHYYRIVNSKIRYKINFTLLDKLSRILQDFKPSKLEKADFYYKIIYNEKVEKQKFNSILEIYQFFSKYSISDLAYYYYKTNDNSAKKYLKIKNIKPLTTGRDLIKIGFNQGKTIGEALDFILEEKIKNKDNFKTKEDEISFLEANFPKK